MTIVIQIDKRYKFIFIIKLIKIDAVDSLNNLGL